MSEGHFHLELDCVTGEKIILQRADVPGALVKVTVNHGVRQLLKIQVRPESLFLALKALNLDPHPAGIN